MARCCIAKPVTLRDMEVCRAGGGHPTLPKLPLDRPVPAAALARRGAISFSSNTSYQTGPRFERRGAISFDKTDKNALYVRMLGDVKGRNKPELVRDRRRSSVVDPDLKILEKLELGQYKTRCGQRFLSLHKARRRHRPSLRFSPDNSSILDDHYGGQAKCLLSTVGDWNFNIFNLDKLTNGRSLFHISVHLFQEHRLIEAFNLDIIKVMRCVTLVEEGYHGTNPYHNSVHAADVAQAMHCFLRENKLAQCVTPLETMTALFAAITHDLDHPGVNQAFLIATSNHLAALYKNSSVLENHHWRSAMGVLHESGIFAHLDSHQWNQIEFQIRSLILATDITRQLEFLSRFKRHVEHADLDLQDREHRHFLTQIALKCADISNPCRPWSNSKKWSERVCDEFFQQGDYERKLQLPVTPNCDRYATTVAKIQAGFMQFVVGPLFQEWHKFNPTHLTRQMLENIRTNKGSWEEIIKEVEAEKQQQTAEEKEEEEMEQEEDRDNLEAMKENISDDSESEGAISIIEMPHGGLLVEGRFELAPVSENGRYTGSGPRRHSLPHVIPKLDAAPWLYTRRQSFPLAQCSARGNIPESNIYQSTSYDRLTEKLASVGGQTNGNRALSLEALVTRPKITTLSPTMEASCLGTGYNLKAQPLRIAQKSVGAAAQASLLAQRSMGGRNSLSTPRLSAGSQLFTRGWDPLAAGIIEQSEAALSFTTFQSRPLRPGRLSNGGSQYRGGGGSRGGRKEPPPLDTFTRLPPIRRKSRGENSPPPLEGYAEDEDEPTLPYDRPRSLSLDIEPKKLLLSTKPRHSFSGGST